MENAGRQAVAAMEAAFDDLATSQRRRALRPRQQRRRRLRRRAHAGAARRRRRRCSCSAASPRCAATRAPTSRSSAASASRSSRSPTRRSGSCTSRELSECDLVVDAILGTGFRGPLTRPARDGRRRRQRARRAGRRDRSADRPVGRLAPASRAPAIEASMTVTLGGAEDSAGLSAGRFARRRPGDRRHRHSAAAVRRARRAATSSC